MSILNPWLWLAVLGMMASSYGVGRWQQYQSGQASHTQALLKATQEAAAEKDKLNQANGVITDELLKDRATAIADAASTAERLRLVSASASKAAAACRRLDEPAAAIIRQELREGLEREAQRADQVTIQLTKLQDYVTRVCQ